MKRIGIAAALVCAACIEDSIWAVDYGIDLLNICEPAGTWKVSPVRDPSLDSSGPAAGNCAQVAQEIVITIEQNSSSSTWSAVRGTRQSGFIPYQTVTVDPDGCTVSLAFDEGVPGESLITERRVLRLSGDSGEGDLSIAFTGTSLVNCSYSGSLTITRTTMQ